MAGNRSTPPPYIDDQLAGRDPHSPEEAADIVVEELMANRGTGDKAAEEAEEAAREVERDEEDR